MSINNQSVVEVVITLLNGIDVDGETMEYIINEVGMRDQMKSQLLHDDESDESVTTNNTLYPVYKCEDFWMDGGQLTIYDAQLVAMVRNIRDFNTVTRTLNYDAIICPQFYKNDGDCELADIVIFK